MKTSSLARQEKPTLNELRRRIESCDHTGCVYLYACSMGVVFWTIVCSIGAILAINAGIGYDGWIISLLALGTWMYCTRGYPRFITTYVRNIRKLKSLADQARDHFAEQEAGLMPESFWGILFSYNPVEYTVEYVNWLPRAVASIRRERRRLLREEQRANGQPETPAMLSAPIVEPKRNDGPSEEEILLSRLSAIDTRTLDSYIRDEFEKYLAEYRAKQKEKRLKVRLYPLRKAAELLGVREYAR